MQFAGAEVSGMSLLVKITSESEVRGRAGRAEWGRGASGSEANDFFEASVWRDIETCRACLAWGSYNYLLLSGLSTKSEVFVCALPGR